MIWKVLFIIPGFVFSTTVPLMAIPTGGFTNGSFETGDFSGWVIQDVPSPNDPLLVRQSGSSLNISTSFSNFTTATTDGQFSASHSFSGNSTLQPNVIRIAQDIFIDHPILKFDHRANWFFAFTTLDSEFSVLIEPAGGGSSLADFPILTAPGLSLELNGQFESYSVDLSSFLGQSVRVSFDWQIAGAFAHPAVVELDNVRLTVVPEPANVTLLCLAMVTWTMSKRFFVNSHQ